MSRRVWMSLPVLLVSVLDCSPQVGLSIPNDASDIQIYALLLSHARLAGSEAVIVQDTTVPYQPLPKGNWLRYRKDTVPSTLVNHLVVLSATPRAVTEPAFPGPIRLVAASEGRRLADTALGGTSVLAVTPVAFSDDFVQALVYYDRRCGALCGGGYELWFVRGPDGRWFLKQDMAHWMG